MDAEFYGLPDKSPKPASQRVRKGLRENLQIQGWMCDSDSMWVEQRNRRNAMDVDRCIFAVEATSPRSRPKRILGDSRPASQRRHRSTGAQTDRPTYVKHEKTSESYGQFQSPCLPVPPSSARKSAHGSPKPPQTARSVSRPASQRVVSSMQRTPIVEARVTEKGTESGKPTPTPVPPAQAPTAARELGQDASEREGTVLQVNSAKFRARPWTKATLQRIDRLKGGTGGGPPAIPETKPVLLPRPKKPSKPLKVDISNGRITPGGSLGTTVDTLPSFGAPAPRSSLGGTQKSLSATHVSLGSQPTCVSENQEGLVPVPSRAQSVATRTTEASNAQLLERIAHLEAKVNSLEVSGALDAAAPSRSFQQALVANVANVAKKAKRVGVLPKALLGNGRLRTPRVAQHRKNSIVGQIQAATRHKGVLMRFENKSKYGLRHH